MFSTDCLKVLLQAPGQIKSECVKKKDFVRTNLTMRMGTSCIVEPEEVLHVGCSPSHLLSALGTDARVQTDPGDL